MSKIDLIFPVLPPTIDGIGDHTVRLAEALSEHAQVGILTAQENWTPVPSIDIQHAFDVDHRRGVLSLMDTVRTRQPSWLLLQFEQFSYGQWGLNPFLPFVLWRIRRSMSGMRIAVMFHEDYMPATDVRAALMSTWQRGQFWALGQLADAAFFTVGPWAQTYQRWFPNTAVHHMPVGSNIPRSQGDTSATRSRLGIDADTFVIGLFGGVRRSRLLDHANAAARACARDLADCLVLYVGPDGDAVEAAVDAPVSVQDVGPLPPCDVSRCFGVMDLYLAPFRHGVSSRRGSFMVALQHAVPTVSTRGPETGAQLCQRDESAFVLSPWTSERGFAENARTLATRPDRRDEIAATGRKFYEDHLDWPQLAERMLTVMG
jgi:glycosyltransferase involved in cell wall biosynthesis